MANEKVKKDIEKVKAYKQGYSDGYNDRIKHEEKSKKNKENT